MGPFPAGAGCARGPLEKPFVPLFSPFTSATPSLQNGSVAFRFCEKRGVPMAVATVEVPRETWQQFFDDFSRQYQGWAVEIEVLSSDMGDQRAAEGAPLQGISYDPRGSQAGDISIGVGDGDRFDSHLVHRPRAVRMAPTQPGE